MPTPEERDRVIKLARVMQENMLASLGIDKYIADVKAFHAETDRMLGRTRPQPEPEVNPADEKRFNDVLAEARAIRTGENR